ncbi:MAG: hypothetical protein IJB51_03660 [Clostridia bacterium]|nr:hypothetical protein [Clostridia bacterium]
MTERIQKLTELTLQGIMYPKPVPTEFDRMDLLLPKAQREVKRICEYILNQEPKLTEYSAFTGIFNFDGSVVGDAFRRGGHTATQEVMRKFYLKPVENLSTMEWQHATADYRKVLTKGLRGILEEIEASKRDHTEPEEIEFLEELTAVANALIAWAHKCSKKVAEFAAGVDNPEYKTNLTRLSAALLRVPEGKPESFYEAVLTIYVCFSADPDSIGPLDRYLSPFYESDLQAGRLTRGEAGTYLQELFLALQAETSRESNRFTRGGESHFCVGGYLPNGEDGFNDFSRLIVESIVDLPTYLPQVTLRWTKKMSKEDFRFMLDAERRDPHKRIAFTNDEKRLQCYTQVCGIPYERAVNFTTVGCNEPAFAGAITGSNSKINLLRSTERLFHDHGDTILAAKTFDEFYVQFEKALFADLELGFDYDNKYNLARARDVNYVSSLFFNDCIENAKSLTQGGGDVVVASPMLLGITNVIDSLIVVKQFVFDEKRISMAELIHALEADWEGYGDLRTRILKTGDFFGNDTPRSNGIAQRLYQSFYEFMRDRTNIFGYHWLVGDLVGYNEHHKWFGEQTKATPDGRHAGDNLKFGIGQSEGRDRNGLSALLNSLAKLDPNAIGCGATVTNLTLDEALVRNDAHFTKLCDMLESYFQNGGVHFQLTYVSREELIAAQKVPDEHLHLRVRVTGFSDYFVNLQESIQDDIISRTTQKG